MNGSLMVDGLATSFVEVNATVNASNEYQNRDTKSYP